MRYLVAALTVLALCAQTAFAGEIYTFPEGFLPGITSHSCVRHDPGSQTTAETRVYWSCDNTTNPDVWIHFAWDPTNTGTTFTPVVTWYANSTDNSKNVCWQARCGAYTAQSLAGSMDVNTGTAQIAAGQVDPSGANDTIQTALPAVSVWDLFNGTNCLANNCINVVVSCELKREDSLCSSNLGVDANITLVTWGF